ncbi:T-cell surface glycoprotein CD3 epsilon chain [Myxocyprinus asiaticus]|uniref:T-cell surface glycoprotein CD3 epsilon chain n=1 Tax=Myxocyprinus asiaticus TaxID=70543 RepID=UPI002222A2E1|nr:T-cell surface glycoprotein CD3 epsilon chain [Myxocyprinus asiaticus]QYF11820.1 CD3 epsilon [Myxocyprinus asiaticus]
MSRFIFMILLITAAVIEVQCQGVEFKGKSAILTCSNEPEAEWYRTTDDKPEKLQEKNITYEASAEGGIVSGLYTCKSGSTKIHFYLKAKVCENCHELSGLMATGVIFSDLLLTAGVILIVYVCAQKNTSNTNQRAPNQRSRDAPQPPNPDYARLNPKTVSKDVYAGFS